MRQLTRDEARRIAIRAQLLDAPRPTDLLAVVRQLTLLQIDPTAAVAPSADLVAWSRLGSSYRASPPAAGPGSGPDALRAQRDGPADGRSGPLPRGHGGLALADEAPREWLRQNDRFRRDILDLLGTLRAAAVPRHPGHQRRGVAVDGLDQQPQRHPDAGVPRCCAARSRSPDAGAGSGSGTWPSGSTRPIRPSSRWRRRAGAGTSGGCGRSASPGRRRPRVPVEPWDVGDAGEPAIVEGVPGTWRVDPDALGKPFEGRTALLSPFDRLVHDRDRALDLFEFEYVLEMYKPKAQRRWGYFALPRPARRSAGRQAGRHGRPQGLEATCTRHPPGRSLHARDERRRSRRAGRPRGVALSRRRLLPVTHRGDRRVSSGRTARRPDSRRERRLRAGQGPRPS